MTTKTRALPRVVAQDVWQEERETLLIKEKAHMRAGDALSAERRRLPMVRIEKEYTFDGKDGRARLIDLFERRRQLIVYHFMFDPSWDEGCPGCSFFTDNLPHLAHLRARDTSLVLVSRAPPEKLETYRKRMGWTFPWSSSHATDFNIDMGVTVDGDEQHGLSVFLRDGEKVFRTYFTGARAVEALGTVWALLDATPYGRQEEWEDSPEGWPQTPPYEWWRRHDRYEDTQGGA